MKINAPFIPDTDYVNFLRALGGRLHAVHFSLYDPALNDARVRIRTMDIQALVDLLKQLPGPRKYVLANGRFQPPSQYFDIDGLRHLRSSLGRLADEGVADGIIFSDAYLLSALSEAAPELAACLEAVPSINFMIDTASRFDAVVAAVERTPFLLPGKITLDRSLNRRPAALAALTAHIRRRCPGMAVELLANEGCLPHCPYRSTHEALIAAANAGIGVDTFRLNQALGCIRVLTESPDRILASPFIRPEDVHRYETAADIVKLCGRTLGRVFLERTVGAYATGGYDGNLLDLLDASQWMAEKWDIPNADLPMDFFDRITDCQPDCGSCGFCHALFRRIARSRGFHINDFRRTP